MCRFLARVQRVMKYIYIYIHSPLQYYISFDSSGPRRRRHEEVRQRAKPPKKEIVDRSLFLFTTSIKLIIIHFGVAIFIVWSSTTSLFDLYFVSVDDRVHRNRIVSSTRALSICILHRKCFRVKPFEFFSVSRPHPKIAYNSAGIVAFETMKYQKSEIVSTNRQRFPEKPELRRALSFKCELLMISLEY